MEADFRAVLGDRIFGEDAEDLARVVGRLLRRVRPDSRAGRVVHRRDGVVAAHRRAGLERVLPGRRSSRTRTPPRRASSASSAETLRRRTAPCPRRRRARWPGEPGSGSAPTSRSRSPASPGPDGGSAEKPVGTVYFGLAVATGATVREEAALRRRPGGRAARGLDPGPRDPAAPPGPGSRREGLPRRSRRSRLGRERPEARRSAAARLPRASWTRPESWHLTLKFLGEITREAAERFAARSPPAWPARGTPPSLPTGRSVCFLPRSAPAFSASALRPVHRSALSPAWPRGGRSRGPRSSAARRTIAPSART